MKTIEAKPLRYHGPGYQIDLPNDHDFIIWAPQETAREGSPNPPRDHWAGAWRDEHGDDGAYGRGASLDEALAVLSSYPDEKTRAAIVAAFRAAFNNEGDPT